MTHSLLESYTSENAQERQNSPSSSSENFPSPQLFYLNKLTLDQNIRGELDMSLHRTEDVPSSQVLSGKR